MAADDDDGWPCNGTCVLRSTLSKSAVNNPGPDAVPMGGMPRPTTTPWHRDPTANPAGNRPAVQNWVQMT
jgi:hypothetical protein